MTKPDPLDCAVPFGRRLITVTTDGSSSLTTPTTSFAADAVTGGALGIGPGAVVLVATVGDCSAPGARRIVATYPPVAAPPIAPTKSARTAMPATFGPRDGGGGDQTGASLMAGRYRL